MALLPSTSVTSSDPNDTPSHYLLTSGSTWSPPTDDADQWLQATLDSLSHVYAVSTLGHPSGHVQTFKLSHAVVESDFRFILSDSDVTSERVFTGNSDSGTIVRNTFATVWTQHVRIHPISFNARIALRWDLHGCAFGYACSPLDVQRGDTGSADVIAGSRFLITCDEGFQFSNGEDERHIECRNEGVWSLDSSASTCGRKFEYCMHGQHDCNYKALKWTEVLNFRTNDLL